MGWLSSSTSKHAKGDAYAAREEDEPASYGHAPPREAGEGSEWSDDDYGEGTDRRRVLAATSGNSDQLWAPSGSSQFAAWDSDAVGAPGGFDHADATPRTTEGGGLSGRGVGVPTHSRMRLHVAMFGGASPKKLSRLISQASTRTVDTLQSEAVSVAASRWRRAVLAAMAEKDAADDEAEQKEAEANVAAAASEAAKARSSWARMKKVFTVARIGAALKSGKSAVREEGISRSGPHPAEQKRLENTPASKPLDEVVRHAVLIVPAKGPARAGTAELVTVLDEYAGFEMHEFVYNRADMSDLVAAMQDCGVVVNGLEGVDPQLWKTFRDLRAAGVLVMNYDNPGLYLPHDNHVDIPHAVPKYLPPYSVKLEERCETRSDGYREVLIHVVSGPDMEAERLLLRNKVMPMLVERCRTRRVRPKYVDLRDDASGSGPGLAVRTAEVAREGAIHVVLLSGKFEPEAKGNERLKRFIEKIPKGGLQAKFDWMRFAPDDYSRTEYVLAQILHLAEEPGWMSTVGGADRRSSIASGSSKLGAASGNSSLSRLSMGRQSGASPTSRLSMGRQSVGLGLGKASGASARDSVASNGSRKSFSRLGSVLGGSGKDPKESSASRLPRSSSIMSLLSSKSSGRSSEGDEIEDAQAALEAAEAAAAAAADSQSQRLAAALRQAALMTQQHVLVYTRDAEFAAAVPETDTHEFYSLDEYERERIGAMLSALYAHPQVAVRPYRADYAPPTEPGGGGFVSGVPGHATDLDDFVSDVLEDIWSRISFEFPPNPAKDMVMWHEREPEFTLQNQLPFYFSRSVQENTVVRCIKLGRPKVIFVASKPGMGVTSMMQRCARECRRLYGNLDNASRDEVVVLSVFSGVGRAHFTPTQILRILAQSIKAHCLHPHDIPGTYNGARAALLSMIRATININRRVAIFIDGVTAADNPRGVAWLLGEEELPAGVQVVIGGEQWDVKMAQTLAQDRRVLLTPEGVLTHAPQKLLRVQHYGIASCVPEAASQQLLLRPMQYLDRKLYVSKHLKLVNIELEDAILTMMLNKPGLVSITYARLMVERMCSFDMDTISIAKQIEKFPGDVEAMLSSRLDELEMIFPRSTLALVLPTIALGCNSITMEDIMAVMITVLDEEEEAYLDSIICPALMWEARHFVTGPFDGTYKIASDTAAKIVLSRYTPDEASKRATFRMLAEYFGDLDEDADENQRAYDAQDRAGGFFNAGGEEGDGGQDRRRRPSPGKGLLARMHQLSPNALDKDGDGRLSDPEAFQEHHLVIDALYLLPYYLTQGRQFGEMCALLRDFSFLQAKLQLGEVAALLEDFDRVLRWQRPAWVEEWDGGDYKVGTADYFQCKRTAERALQADCRGYHAEAFQKWMGDSFGDPESGFGDIVAYRDLLRRNMAALHRRPHLILQTAMNAPGDAEPGAAAEDKVRQLSPPPRGVSAKTPGAYCFADAEPGEEFFLLWGNRPEEAPVMETCERDVHSEAVTAVVWLDGQSFITGGEEGLVAAWSAVTGECAARLTGHTHSITCLLYADVIKQGKRVVSGSRDCTVRVWKLEGDMGRTCHTLRGHTDHVTSLALVASTGELISAGCDRRFCVWDLTQNSEKQIHRVETTHVGPINSITVSPEGTSFVTASADKTVQVWSMTPTHKKTAVQQRREAAEKARDPTAVLTEQKHPPELALKLQGHLSDVTCCAYGQSGASLATASLDHSIMLWNPVAGTHVGILVGHTNAVTDISYCSNGRFLVSASRDHHLRIWHPRSGSTVLVLKHSCVLHSVRFSPDVSQLLVAADDGGVCLWSWVGREGSSSMGQMPRKPNLFSRGHKIRDANETGAESGSMRNSKASMREETNPLSFEGQAHKGATTAVAGFTNMSIEDEAGGGEAVKGVVSESVLSGGEDGFVRKISSKKAPGKVEMTFKGHSKAIRALATSPDMTTAVSASDDGNLMLWDTITGEDTGVLTGHKGPVLACCFAAGGDRVLSGGKDQLVRIWDVQGGGGGGVLVAEAAFEGHTGRITGLASVNGRGVFASCSTDRTTRVWDMESEATIRTLTGHDGGLTSLSATANAALAVTTSLDYTVRAWDVRDPYGADGGAGGEVRKLSLPHVPVGCAACPKQEAWFGVVAGDGLYVYDTRMWREVAYFQGLAPLKCVAFHGTGRVFCGDASGRIYSLDIWKAPARSWV